MLQFCHTYCRERSADETWDGQWTDASISSIQSPPGLAERVGSCLILEVKIT